MLNILDSQHIILMGPADDLIMHDNTMIMHDNNMLNKFNAKLNESNELTI